MVEETPTPARIQVASDLHMEYRRDAGAAPLVEKDPACDTLVLAGDIASLHDMEHYRGVVRAIAEQGWAHVFLLAGNHEHWTPEAAGPDARAILSYEDYCGRLRSLETDVVHVLNRDVHTVAGRFAIAGCTLWTSLRAVPLHIGHADFARGPAWFDRAMYTRLHDMDIAFLRDAVRSKADLPLVVATHHLPARECSDPHYAGMPGAAVAERFFYADDVDPELVGAADLWIAGHTHRPFDLRVHGTRIVGNPRGTPYTDSDRVWRTDMPPYEPRKVVVIGEDPPAAVAPAAASSDEGCGVM